MGEGDIATVELFNGLKRGETEVDIKGVVYWKEGELVLNGKADYIGNLEDLPIPDRPTKQLITTKGCINSCKHCYESGVGYPFRMMSGGRIAEIMIHMHKHGVTSFEFRDDLSFHVNG